MLPVRISVCILKYLLHFAFSPNRRSTGGLHGWEAPNTKLLRLRRRCPPRGRGEDTYSNSKMWGRNSIAQDDSCYCAALWMFQFDSGVCVISFFSQSKPQNLLQQSSHQNQFFIRYRVDFSYWAKLIPMFASSAFLLSPIIFWSICIIFWCKFQL